jgi:transposase-like protein
VACLERDLGELLAFYAVKNPNLWAKVRTTNPIERAFREVKRRTRPMGVFVNKQSMERILYAVFTYLNNSWKQKAL